MACAARATCSAARARAPPSSSSSSSSRGAAKRREGGAVGRREALGAAALVLAAPSGPALAAEKGVVAVAKLTPATAGQGAEGTVTFREAFTKRGRKFIEVDVALTGLAPGSVHGLNIHERGDADSPEQTGLSYNPEERPHGDRVSFKKFGASASHYLGDGLLTWHHVGDLGNVTAGPDGVAKLSFTDDVIKLDGDYPIMGRSVVLHAKADDLTSQGPDDGNAGPVIAFGTIRKA